MTAGTGHTNDSMRLPPAIARNAVLGVERSTSSSTRFGSHPTLVAALIAVALVLAFVLTFGLRWPAGDRTAAAPSLPTLLQDAGSLVVFSELGEGSDTLWAARPDDPGDRVALGRAAHAPWYGIFPSLSPDGEFVAYTVLPLGSRAAELWVLEIDSGETTRLARDVDLPITPVWAPASDAVIVRRSEGLEGDAGSVQLLRVDLAGAAVPVISAETALFPIDFSADGVWLYYAMLSPSGTDLARAPAGGVGGAEPVAHLNDGFARDWHLSPDGKRLAYLGQALGDGGVSFIAQVLDLSTGVVQAPLGESRSAQFNPIWEPGGALTVGRLDATGGSLARLSVDDGGLATTAALLPLPDGAGAGFDVPLSWSPDGVHLAVRSFERASVSDPGRSRIVVVSANGERHELSPVSDVIVAGWLEASR